MLKKPQEMENNPIYQRLTLDSGWPDDRAARWLIVGVFGAGLLLDLAALLVAPPWLSWLVMCLGWISILITPAISAVVAVFVVNHDLQKEDFQMVRLTLATDKSLLHGYTFGTLHRLRIFLISTRSLLPSLLALGLILLHLFDLSALSIILSVCFVTAGTLLIVIAIRQFSELGAALGVTLAIWWQRPILAAVGALLIMLFGGPVLIAISWGIIYLMCIISGSM